MNALIHEEYSKSSTSWATTRHSKSLSTVYICGEGVGSDDLVWLGSVQWITWEISTS